MPRTMIIDDDEGTRDTFQLILRLEGIPTVVASTAEEGLTLAVERPFGLIITDLRLPGMNGIDFLRDLRFRGVDTPVVIMSAYATTTSVVSAMKAGASDVVDKPVDERTLVELVRARCQWHPVRIENNSLASRVVGLIQRDFDNPSLSTGALARHLDVSTAHLCRAVKSATDKSPEQLIREARVTKARALLRHTSKSIKEISFECGFHSVQHLEHSFSDTVGQTPTEYRRTHNR